MSSHEHMPADFNVADIIGDNFPSPQELAESLSESELHDRIANIHNQQITQLAMIADHETKLSKLRAEAQIAQQALGIARDKGLE